jgi:hypothetical protein
MKFIHILSLLLISCSHITNLDNEHDIFQNIINVMTKKSIDELNSVFGKPDETVEPTQDFKFKILRYNSKRIDVYVDPIEDKISHLTLFYFEDFDNYLTLKKRFKDFKWVEEKILDDKSGHVLTDQYLVKLPEIRMQFQYDNYVPKRKVMWIYFN